MTRARWFLVGGAVVVGAVVAAAVALKAGGDDPVVTAEPSVSAGPTASVNPAISASPAPTPSHAPSGYLPVDSFGASEIPWDEVGPGWFLVEWVEHETVWGDGDVAVTHADFSVSLLSPAGTWFTGPSLASTGADWTTFWWGDSIAVFKVTGGGTPDGLYGDTSLVSLKDGAIRSIISADLSPNWFEVAGDGSLIGVHYWEGGGGTDFYRYDTSFNRTDLCGGTQWYTASLSPDGVRLVCFGDGPAGTGKTNVTLSQVGGAGETTVIDVFKSYPDSYSISGWFDADTFLLKRGSISDTPDAYFTYNIETRKIAEFVPPFPAGEWVQFDSASRTYATSRHPIYAGEDLRVDFFTESGAPLAAVQCTGLKSQASFVFSGSYALVTCETHSTDSADRGRLRTDGVVLSLVDLATGTVVEVANAKPNSLDGLSVVGGYPANL